MHKINFDQDRWEWNKTGDGDVSLASISIETTTFILNKQMILKTDVVLVDP